jgi:hypothetical protein
MTIARLCCRQVTRSRRDHTNADAGIVALPGDRGVGDLAAGELWPHHGFTEGVTSATRPVRPEATRTLFIFR